MIIVPSITDINGTTHKNCPRCGGAWIINDSTSLGFKCELDSCSMIGFGSISYPDNQCQLLCRVEHNYVVSWHQGFCMVNSHLINNTKLPILPYDISLNKLKTYLLFS